MKRFISIALAALLIVAALAGCGKSGSPVGKYVVKSIGGKTVEEAFQSMLSEYGEGVTLDDLLKMFGMESLDEFMTIELKSDGTATASIAMEDEAPSGTWKQEGDKILVTFDGDTSEFTLKGNELIFTMDEQEYVLIKK